MHSEIIDQIRAWHRKRNFVMETRKRADLALGSSLRTWLGWRRDLEKEQSDRIKDLASKLVACGEKLAKGKDHELSDTEEWMEHGEVILAAIASRLPTDALEKKSTKEMERLAMLLPVWTEFAEPIRGFGARSLAVIVGEAGDLSSYSTHSKLWKRMGLAVMEGVRQGGLRKNSDKDLWIEHGYNKMRRSRMYVIGDTMIKTNGDGAYRATYLARKEYEKNRAVASGLTVAPTVKIPKGRQDEFMSDGHVHRRAQRYMEKRLLRDLWKAWRRAVKLMPEKAVHRMLATAIVDAPKGAGEARCSMPSKAMQRMPPQKIAVASKDAEKAMWTVPKKASERLPSRKSKKAA